MKIFLYICGRVVRIDPLMNKETRTPLPTTFCSGLQKTGEMKTINLTQGHVALVDDDDYDYLMQWKWQLNNIYRKKEKSKYVYAGRKTWIKKQPRNQSRKVVFMHRVIMDAPINMVVDHIDHNGLNNQKNNLRVCSPTQNKHNRLPSGKSKYLGVHIFFHKTTSGTYRYIRSAIKISGKMKHLGVFKTEEEAAMAYDVVAKEQYGEFANLNFKD